MSDIFISYAKEDRARARCLAEALEEIGWSVWWDREIPTGKSFTDVIKGELDGARCAIVLWSANSVSSRWVKREAKRADDQKKLFPVLIENVMPPWVFEELQACDLTDWDGGSASGNFSQLVSDMGRILGAAPKPARKPTDGQDAMPPRVEPAPHDPASLARETRGAEGKRRLLRLPGSPALWYGTLGLALAMVLLMLARPWWGRSEGPIRAAADNPAAAVTETRRPGEASIDRGSYAVSVLGVPNAAAAIAAMRAAGYPARQYGPSGRADDEFQVISIGSKVPAKVAQELLPIAHRLLPGLRYVVITEDRPGYTARGDVGKEISFAVTNRALSEFRQVTPLPPGGWQRLKDAPDDRTFARTVRAYYRVK